MSNYGKIITGLVVVWFVTVLSASALHLFENGAGRFGAGVALAAFDAAGDVFDLVCSVGEI